MVRELAPSGGPSQQHTVLNRVYVHGDTHRFALNDPSKRSLGAADLGIWSVSTLHLDFIGNSYTIRTTIFKFEPCNLSLVLIFLDTTKVEVYTQSLLVYNQGIYLL